MWASPSLPWWKQKRVLVIGLTVLVIIVVVVIVLGVTLSSSSNNGCFGADDNGFLNNAVRLYVHQDCANNEKCEIVQTYGWPLNSWCVGNVNDMSFIVSGMDTFNEDISD